MLHDTSEIWTRDLPGNNEEGIRCAEKAVFVGQLRALESDAKLVFSVSKYFSPHYQTASE